MSDLRMLPLSIMIVAGEASGDLHGANLLLALRKRCPTLQAVGIGGQKLRAAGLVLLADVNQLSAVGLFEILGSVPRHLVLLNQLKRQMARKRPDAVVLVDYHGFNKYVAHEAHRREIPVFFYIAPKVWVWGRGRAKRMSDYIDRLAVIFPFEEALFNVHTPRFAHYVGHPLLDGLRVTMASECTRKKYGFSHNAPLLALMPGSRRSEVRLLLPDMLRAATLLKRVGWQIALIQAPTVERGFLDQVAGRHLPVTVIKDDAYNVLAAADVSLVASGTATLEAAMLGCPPVTIYRFSWLTYVFIRLVIGQRQYALPNILLGRRIFPEFIQKEVKPDRLARAVANLHANRSQVKASLLELQSIVGLPGASERASNLLFDILK